MNKFSHLSRRARLSSPLQVPPRPSTASERRGNALTKFEDFKLNAKAIIWP